MKPPRLLNRLASGGITNVRFSDMVGLLKALGFTEARVSGSHHIFTHPGIPELLNLQSVGGEAKPYQIRQSLRLIERYNLSLARKP